jgi:hypothetical protein
MTTTTTTQSARVDVLTAEVRALQVGSRQVTLSVYRQLDRLPVNERSFFEPFGRVRDNQDPSGVNLVGRDTRTSALVRLNMPAPFWRRDRPGLKREPLLHWVRHHTDEAEWCRYGGDEVTFIIGGEPPRQYSWVINTSRRAACSCDQGPELDAWVEHYASLHLASLNKLQDQYDAYEAMPLIVLAGLR